MTLGTAVTPSVLAKVNCREDDDGCAEVSDSGSGSGRSQVDFPSSTLT